MAFIACDAAAADQAVALGSYSFVFQCRLSLTLGLGIGEWGFGMSNKDVPIVAPLTPSVITANAPLWEKSKPLLAATAQQ